jgi:hypothetical protein
MVQAQHTAIPHDDGIMANCFWHHNRGPKNSVRSIHVVGKWLNPCFAFPMLILDVTAPLLACLRHCHRNRGERSIRKATQRARCRRDSKHAERQG